MEVLDDGTRLLVTSADEERGVIEAVVQPGASGLSAEFVGTMDASSVADAPADGIIDLVFTATFDTPTHAATSIGGTIESAGTTCTVERTGEANRIGD